jgi:hypothetical protein|tara:strand:+ start:344 stop:541 length:198 start_codon:yes stop_codon:yes gene_type:complete
MPTFWENVLRFPRFFISSVIGLVLIIFGPSLNLLRKPQTTVIFFAVLGSTILLLQTTLKAMLDLE